MRICIRHEWVIIGICANIFDKYNNLMPSCYDACEWACRFYKELWSHRQLTSSTEIWNDNLPLFLRKSHHFIFLVFVMVAGASLLFSIISSPFTEAVHRMQILLLAIPSYPPPPPSHPILATEILTYLVYSWHVHRLLVSACTCRFRWLTRTACLQNFQAFSHFQVH